ncbi:MarR family winged helix-turn-helix transcriptional regulator [Shinella curvata]|uniref:MarR family winged helix-turn-helix transcriptional regulator n=1 Tax=Shinella curvata TaxID=1817964 RepID=A0ABT8XAK7_9HYPH|nr:MarR family winged helix-turn-helix transcriptional regulator [Shinella curvata]MCJ8054845.1 MarR family winged helix-turn-helix transcriptional regulator [Shinella curvata]MDO6120759.1 MarR family winged helix-turn-helix transcriptional regulator [Shinella curvata]
MEKISETYNATSPEALAASTVSQSVVHQLRRAHGRFMHRFLHHFSAVNLRPAEYSALALIAENPGRKQSEIAATLGIQRANFVSLMNDLEGRCLTERRSVPNDRRSHALYLTASGQNLLSDARRAEADFEAECLERLGGTPAREQFLALLARLFG